MEEGGTEVKHNKGRGVYGAGEDIVGGFSLDALGKEYGADCG